jgi:hypothetical protein
MLELIIIKDAVIKNELKKDKKNLILELFEYC